MIARETASDGGERPHNNLLRHLSTADFALITPYLVHEEAKPNNLLYNPGDDVEIVHFPCGPSLASYLVANEDGRDVETILVGREGAVGGIVSEGYLPAYTRIIVKFGGPFVRLHVGKLDAAKTKSTTLRNVFARYADCMLAQIFQSTACNAIHSIEQRTAKWIISAMERTDGDNIVPLTHEQLATMLGVGAQLCQPGDADVQGGRGSGDPPRFDPGARPRGAAYTGLPLQRIHQKPLRGSPARGLSHRGGLAREEIRLTKSQTTHCFSAIPDYIAAQRASYARSFWPGFLFGRDAPASAADLKFLQRVPRVRVRNFKSKSGTRNIELLVPLCFRSSRKWSRNGSRTSKTGH